MLLVRGGVDFRWVPKTSVVFAVLLAIAGCSDVGTRGTAPLTLTLQSQDSPPDDPVFLEGVRVCELETTNCVLSDANGRAVLELPVDVLSWYTLDKEGYAPWLLPHVVPAEGAAGRVSLWTADRIAEEHASVSSPYPMRGTGTVGVVLYPGFPGVTFELVGATGSLFYVTEERAWSDDLKATTSRGAGGFTEVTPGEVQIGIGGTAEDCFFDHAAPGDAPNRVRIVVREGYFSAAGVSCPLPQ